MRNIDEKDLEIVELLLEDARRPYSEIAKKVDLSPPTVSDRIERLQADGIIERFTLDVNESMIDDHADLLLELDVETGAAGDIEAQLDSLSIAGHVYRTVESVVIAEFRAPTDEVEEAIHGSIDMDAVNDYEVRLVSSASWTPSVSTTETKEKQAMSATPSQD